MALRHRRKSGVRIIKETRCEECRHSRVANTQILYQSMDKGVYRECGLHIKSRVFCSHFEPIEEEIQESELK